MSLWVNLIIRSRSNLQIKLVPQKVECIVCRIGFIFRTGLFRHSQNILRIKEQICYIYILLLYWLLCVLGSVKYFIDKSLFVGPLVRLTLGVICPGIWGQCLSRVCDVFICFVFCQSTHLHVMIPDLTLSAPPVPLHTNEWQTIVEAVSHHHHPWWPIYLPVPFSWQYLN